MRQGDLKGEGLEWQGSFPLLIHLLIWDDRNRNGVLMSRSKGFFRTSRKQGSWCKGSYRAHRSKSLKFRPSWGFLSKTKRGSTCRLALQRHAKVWKSPTESKAKRIMYLNFREHDLWCGFEPWHLDSGMIWPKSDKLLLWEFDTEGQEPLGSAALSAIPKCQVSNGNFPSFLPIRKVPPVLCAFWKQACGSKCKYDS